MRIFKRRAPVERLFTAADVNRVSIVMGRAYADAARLAVEDIAPGRYPEFAERVDWHLHQAGARDRADAEAN